MTTPAPQQRVLIAPGLNAESDPRFVDLRDPKSGHPSTYLLTTAGLHELNWFKQQYSSWFVGDAVLADGGAFLATPVDPLLLLLPVLEAARGEGRFCDVEHILECAGAAAAALLAPLVAAQLRCVCDAKEAGGHAYFRLNEDKALAWLRLKVAAAAAALRAAPGSAFAAMDPPALTAYAAGLLGEYLAPAWEGRLATALGLQAASQPGGASRGGVPAGVPLNYDTTERFLPSEAKRPRLDPKEAARSKAAKDRAEAKKKAAAKEAAGMRKMSNFFTKAAAAAP